jgi:hypothetical protein
MLDFLSAKGFRAEVTEGIDLEQSVLLTGARITIGSGPRDSLRLGAADVVPAHLTFERRADGKGWDYFTTDQGFTEVDNGNPRTGKVRAGMWFRLGQETRIDLARADVPASTAPGSDQTGNTVPLPVALGILGALAAAAVFVSVGFGGNPSGPAMKTTGYVAGSDDLTTALESCLTETMRAQRAVAASDPASPYFRIMEYRGSDPARAITAQAELIANVRGILADAHFLVRENKLLEASGTLRRLEYVLPVSITDCPILAASNFDAALLEVRGSK